MTSHSCWMKSRKSKRRADIEGKIDAARVAIGGHSFGAAISMMKIGLVVNEQMRDEWGEMYDDRFQAAVLLSAPGRNLDEMGVNAFDNVRKPLICDGRHE